MTQKPKILLAIRSLSGRGGERSVLTLAQGFYEIGCEVHILCFHSSQDYDLNPNFIYHLIDINQWYRKLFITSSLRYKYTAKLFDQYVSKHIGQPDLILSNLIQSNRILSYSKLNNIAYVIRNTFSKENENALKKNPEKVLKRYREVYKKHPCICVSKGVEDDLKNTLGDLPEVATIYNAFDQEYMQTQANEFQPDLGDYLLHVGAFCYAKAHDVLLKAYAKSSQQLPLYLLGKGELEDETKQLVDTLKLNNQVHFLGFNKNPYPFIQNAKALVLSSRYEGFVRVVPEALALGTSVISTDCPSGPNEVLAAKNLVAVDDIDALAEKMNQVMQNPSEFHVEFDSRFLPKNIAKLYLSYFKINISN